MARRLGAIPLGDGRCSFTVWAPHAQRVELRLLDPDGRVVELQPADHGYHVTTLPDVDPAARYVLRLDGGDELPDPASRSQPEGPHGPSQVVDHEDWFWTDDDWYGIPLRDYVIYELHVGTFTPEGTFEAVIPRLQELAALGVTAIEIMPVAQFPGSRNWGYDGVDLYAPQDSYGGPGGLKSLVDACHQHGIAVVLDVVYNHLGPEGNYLARFGPYFSHRHRTPWGEAVNVDGPGSDEVRSFFIQNALEWITDYHVDALRLDAIHGIIDTSAYPFLAELSDAVADRAEALNRRAYLIAESDLNDVRVITPRSAGGIGHDSQWCDDFHHALHALVTGERDGYYADYGELHHLAAAMRKGFVYTGQRSRFRGRRHGSSTVGIPGERFVVYSQNHDQVGNRKLGDRRIEALDHETRKLVAGAVLLSPFVPMLFMGEEYGDPSPFPYFVSHTDAGLVDAVRKGRKREFESFDHAGDPPDPQAEETFRSAVLQWALREQGRHAQLLELHRELLRLRGLPSIARMRPGAVQVECDARTGVLAIARTTGADETVVVLNFGPEQQLAGPLLPGAAYIEAAGPHGGVGTADGGPDGPTTAAAVATAAHPATDLAGWRCVLDSADERFGGPGALPGIVAPNSVAVFHRELSASDR